jgi:protein required for attachment to host cells
MTIRRPANRAATVPDARLTRSWAAAAAEATDWHKIEQHHFAQRVAAAAAELVRATKPTQFIVIAPPKTLADLRNMFSADVEALVVAEIDKNLTHLSVGEIEKYLVGEN